MCPKLLEMVRIRCAALQAHEKRVSLTFDGMTLIEMLNYHKDRDELFGFVSYGNLVVLAPQLIKG